MGTARIQDQNVLSGSSMTDLGLRTHWIGGVISAGEWCHSRVGQNHRGPP
jgi:hypothetical protein